MQRRNYHSGDTVTRFNQRADDYARYRPSYPPAAIDAIFDGLAPPPKLRIVDVGAGTGISSKLLAERGARVIAVEPNDEMRAVALGAGFQAFHWFAEPATIAEFGRVLAPGGRLAIVWNERDDGDPFTRGYGEIVDRFAKRTNLAGYATAPEMFARLLPGTVFGEVRARAFPNAQRLDRDGLLGRVRSTSYAPRSGDEADVMLERLEALFERFAGSGGSVEIVYQTEVYLVDKEVG